MLINIRRMQLMAHFVAVIYASFVCPIFCVEPTITDVLKKLKNEFDLPLPEKVESGKIWYQLIIVPEQETQTDYTLIVTISSTITTLHRADAGTVSVHKCTKGKSELIGDKALTLNEVEELFRLSGLHEVFTLPIEQKVTSYEFFPHFGGNERILIRKDWENTSIVRRRSWASASVKIFSDYMINLGKSLLPTQAKK